MYLDEIKRKIETMVDLVPPDLKGEVLKLSKEIMFDTVQVTMFEFKKGMESLITHIEKHIDTPLPKDDTEKS